MTRTTTHTSATVYTHLWCCMTRSGTESRWQSTTCILVAWMFERKMRQKQILIWKWIPHCWPNVWNWNYLVFDQQPGWWHHCHWHQRSHHSIVWQADGASDDDDDVLFLPALHHSPLRLSLDQSFYARTIYIALKQLTLPRSTIKLSTQCSAPGFSAFMRFDRWIQTFTLYTVHGNTYARIHTYARNYQQCN